MLKICLQGAIVCFLNVYNVYDAMTLVYRVSLQKFKGITCFKGHRLFARGFEVFTGVCRDGRSIFKGVYSFITLFTVVYYCETVIFCLQVFIERKG